MVEFNQWMREVVVDQHHTGAGDVITEKKCLSAVGLSQPSFNVALS